MDSGKGKSMLLVRNAKFCILELQ